MNDADKFIKSKVDQFDLSKTQTPYKQMKR